MSSLARLHNATRRFRFARAAEPDRVRLFDLGSVGSDVRLTGWVHFGSEPFLVHIGSNVTIAGEVAFITHDGGVRVLRDRHPGLHIYDSIHIGDDVFIGMRAIVMPGVTIGSRCVIGAGSVVTKDIPAGTVAAGVPCRPIRSIDEYEARSLDRGLTWPAGAYGTPEWRAAVIRHCDTR